VPTSVTGTAANNTQVEADGTLKFNGDATTWDDLTGSLIARRLDSTTGRLQYDFDENAIIMQDDGSITNSADTLIFNFQYPHAAKTDGEMRLHIHWEQTSTDDLEFTVQHRIQNNGAEKTTAWTTTVVSTNTNNVFTFDGHTTLNQITSLVNVDMTGASISATVQFKVARTDDTGGDDILAVFVDAHVNFDTIGSRTEYAK